MPHTTTTTQPGNVRLEPSRRLQGVYRPPADKSIAHRALIISALAQGRSLVSPVTRSLDVASTAACLRQLGVDVALQDDTWVVASPGIARWIAPERSLDCGNSGTTMRLLAGCLAGSSFEATLIGDESLSRRPMGRIADPLRRMGARITLSPAQTAPLRIDGTSLSGISYPMPVPSAQVKSAVLLAGLQAAGTTSVIEEFHSRDHTERMLAAAGVDCHVETASRPVGDKRELLLAGTLDADAGTQKRTIRIGDKRRVQPYEWTIPGDFSAAAFMLVAALGAHKSHVIIDQVGLNPTRTGLLRVLRRMGAEIEIKRQGEVGGEPVGQIHVEASTGLKATRVSEHEIPSLIDELPVLAVMAANAEGVTVIRGAGELRHKETDRIAAVSANLRAMGAKVAELEDGWAVEGPTDWHGAEIDPHGDHRIAMAFSVAALWADAPSVLHDARVIAISDPDFLSSLVALTH